VHAGGSTVTAVKVLDATLRDGSHAVRHALTPDQVTRVAAALDRAGVYAVGVGHGDGIGGSSVHFGRASHPDAELWRAAAAVLEHARLAVTLVPGVGCKEHLHLAKDCGATLARIATHCTEADIALQHIEFARALGLEPQGDLMMPHMTDPASLARQARKMVDAGATAVHVMDSAGALTPPAVRERIEAMLDAFGGDAEAGMHAHDNLSLAVANTLAAIEAGATRVDSCLAGMGAGAGNCRTEVLAAVLDKLGHDTGLDLWALQDAAEDIVGPLMKTPPTLDRRTLTLGYAGVPSSFLRHVERAAERFDVDSREILIEVGRRQAVSGQEDLVLEIAAGLHAAPGD
jgi:4-hydroxy 2-oxovalerate aldolase